MILVITDILVILSFLIHEHVISFHLGLCFLSFIGIFANRNGFTSSFRIFMPCISVSWLAAMAKTSTMILNRSGESEHSYLITDLRGKCSVFSLLNMIVAMSTF